MARVPGGFMTVHAGWRGSGRERLSNTVLRYGLNLGERNRGERGPK
jgi:copper oxidase (laccase) domain-containing protein